MLLSQIVPTMGWPFTIVYMLLVLGCLYFLLVSIPKTVMTKYWPKACGSVVVSKLEASKRLTKDGGKITVYSPLVKYRYCIAGQQYTSQKIKWADHRSSSKNAHQKVVDKYPVNSDITVFYNPKKPGVAVLEPGIGQGTVIITMFFLISLISMSVLLSTKL